MPATAQVRSDAGRLEADAAALHEALSELVRVYQFRDRDRICCHDISVTQCYALEALLRRGPCGLNELAAELYLDKSTASRVVAALERKGYVSRAPHPEDGRAVVLTVTPAGRRLHDRIREGPDRRGQGAPGGLRARGPRGRGAADPAAGPGGGGPVRRGPRRRVLPSSGCEYR